jgi:hypothetical protein
MWAKNHKRRDFNSSYAHEKEREGATTGAVKRILCQLEFFTPCTLRGFFGFGRFNHLEMLLPAEEPNIMPYVTTTATLFSGAGAGDNAKKKCFISVLK